MSDIGGVWRTVGGRRIFIKDGQSLDNAMKESGKFGENSQEQKKIYIKFNDYIKMIDDVAENGTLEEIEKKQKELKNYIFMTEEEQKEKIKGLENKLSEKEIVENPGYILYKLTNEETGDVRYAKCNDNGTVEFRRDKEKATKLRPDSKKLEEIKKVCQEHGYKVENIGKKQFKEETYKYLGSFRDKIERELETVKGGLSREWMADDIKYYNSKLSTAKDKKIYEDSYVYKNARKDLDKYNSNWYGQGDRENPMANPAVFSELIKRTATKMGDIEEVHSSAKSGSKFSNSIYLKDKNTAVEVRISNHSLPETAEREYNREKYGGTRWDKELVLDRATVNELIGIKTKKEFENYVKKLFKDEDDD